MTELIPQAKNGISSPSGSSLPLQKKAHRLQFSQLECSRADHMKDQRGRPFQ